MVYAVPGVPYEMQQMITDHVLPDLLERSGEQAVIVSRSLKTWGTSGVGLAELIADRVDVQGNPTIAFLARGIEGLYVRLTAKAATEAEARALLDAEEAELHPLIGELVFAVDDQTMESVVLDACPGEGLVARGRGVAHRRAVGARLASVPGASHAFRGSIASYATQVKRSLLGVTSESGGQRGSRDRDGRRARSACWVAKSHCRSPVSPAPTSRTGSPSARCGSGWRSPATPPTR